MGLYYKYKGGQISVQVLLTQAGVGGGGGYREGVLIGRYIKVMSFEQNLNCMYRSWV